MTDKTVAMTILSQLGGNKFLAMTGASSLAYSADCLSFRIGRNEKRVNGVRITLNAHDYYDVIFLRMGRAPNFDVVKVAEHSDVCCEDLRSLFEQETGMATSL